MKKHFYQIITALLLILLLTGVGCKKAAENINGDGQTRQGFEGAAAFVSYAIFDIFWSAYEAALAIPADASYSGGWWSFSIVLVSGESAEIEIKFQDKNQNTQKFYNPATTHYIKIKGSSSGTLGTITFDLTLSGVQTSSNTLTVNGSGTVTTGVLTASYKVNDMEVPKTIGAYPESGNIRITFTQTSLTITFDGSRYATATYTFLGLSYSIKIDLDTGGIS
ncbi:MAG: hypothetical protein KAW12_04390 [Candidatus Aminicenantes bacterium]|nr:hypothetical protein [Candidatus Aminicenantes bacterium]